MILRRMIWFCIVEGIYLQASGDKSSSDKKIQEEPEVEEPSKVCGFLLQKDASLETIQERETATKFPHQFHDPVYDYLVYFFGLK